MAIMAGMLPGVERARWRRLRLRLGRASSSSSGARGGHDPARLLGGPSSSSAPKGWSVETPARAWTLDGNAREAKERLDQKLRGQRQREPSVLLVKKIKRHQSTGAAGSSSQLLRHPPTEAAGATPCPRAVRRDVFSAPEEEEEGRRRWLSCCWARLGRLARRGRRPQAEACAEECAVCLEALRAGDVVARLPCAHRFHWSCVAPWVQAASRCPVCRARALLVPKVPKLTMDGTDASGHWWQRRVSVVRDEEGGAVQHGDGGGRGYNVVELNRSAAAGARCVCVSGG